MKIIRLFLSLFVLALCLVVLVSASFAKPNPLNTPTGLAVDAAGNLYVANFGGGGTGLGNILIYSSGYVQKTSKTITAGIAGPQAVQFDPYGNLWVSNLYASNGGSTGSITEYTNGVQNASATITNGIDGPLAIAIDGLDNLWVVNGENNITVYSPTAVYAPPSNLVRTINPGISPSINALAVGAGALAYSTNTNFYVSSASAVLQGNPSVYFADHMGASAFAPDNSGNIYISSLDSKNTMYIVNSSLTIPAFVTLPFASSRGMAVDNGHHRLYVSNTTGNEILVYSTLSGSTYGTLIHTIHN